MNTKKSKKDFSDLGSEDVDLTMFTITDLTLTKDKEANLVFMAIELKRKVVTELVTTYFPTILLLLITFTTIFFDKDLFGDAIAVNLTIMLVMTTIFTSKIEELPPTSDMKMIDIWLICCFFWSAAAFSALRIRLYVLPIEYIFFCKALLILKDIMQNITDDQGLEIVLKDNFN